MLFDPKLGLVLGGGGARGGAHIGVMQVLRELNYNAEVVVGTSAGGLVAVMHGAGWSLDDMAAFFDETDFASLVKLDRSGRGLVSAEGWEHVLEECFGALDMRDLSPKTAVIVADLKNFRRVIIHEGDVVTALRATTAVPGIFPPLQWGDALLVDGGIVDNVPTQAAYQLGAERVVAVDVGIGITEDASMFSVSEKMSGVGHQVQRLLYWLLSLSNRQQTFDALTESTRLTYHMLVQYHLALYPPDVLIEPHMPNINTFDLDRVMDAIEPGRLAAQPHMNHIRDLMRRRFFPHTRHSASVPPLQLLNLRAGGVRSA